MNEFETTLMSISKEAEEIQKDQLALAQRSEMFNHKLQGFLKESGLPENFTMPQLMLLGIRKARA